MHAPLSTGPGQYVRTSGESRISASTVLPFGRGARQDGLERETRFELATFSLEG